MGELESALNRLKREARQAEKFKTLSAEIRTLQSAVLYARWKDASESLTRIEAEAAAVAAHGGGGDPRGGGRRSTEAAKAEGAIKPLREEEQVAAAVLQRLAIEKDRLEVEAERAKAEIERIKDELRRTEEGREREAHIVADAHAALERLAAEIAEVQALTDQAPSRIPELQGAWEAADAERLTADAELEKLTGEAAADEARRRAAESRIEEARARLGRTNRALDLARGDRAALGPDTNPAVAEADGKLQTALAVFREAQKALEAADAERVSATSTPRAKARDGARKLEDQLGRLKTEARGLAQLTAPQKKSGFAPAIEQVSPRKGAEAALAAALGDDLDAALDAKAPAFWGGAEAKAPKWPEGVEPLADVVQAPPELAARLAFTGLVKRADGDKLAKALPPGARLVSKEGDLWRWDGFVSRANAAKPAAIRLEQRARLLEAEAEIDRSSPAAAKSRGRPRRGRQARPGGRGGAARGPQGAAGRRPRRRPGS